MNSSSSSVQALNQRKLLESMGIIRRRPIVLIGIIEKRKRSHAISYIVEIVFRLKEKKN